ncbi:phosphoribosylglycinamide formyltransferase [Bdellovibrio sp. HCB337]|uniref:phosphoribosylglycinamide formyltransferase n=1 Tax=Bdellovibrio sp. HCB337 TaxID=3394358 RepID=UPI0039A76DB4
MGVSSPPRIAILASGRGSNFEAIARAVGNRTLQAEIALVGSDRADALVLDKAKALGIPTLVEKDQAKLKSVLMDLNIQYLVLAGYMRILKEDFLQGFADTRGFHRIVNIHPSLLPDFPGLDSYRQAYEAKVPQTGVTVHFVDGGVDTGPICAQKSFSIADCQSLDEVERRGLAIEHQLYPETLNWILSEKFEILNHKGKLHVQPR